MDETINIGDTVYYFEADSSILRKYPQVHITHIKSGTVEGTLPNPRRLILTLSNQIVLYTNAYNMHVYKTKEKAEEERKKFIQSVLSNIQKRIKDIEDSINSNLII